jgi:phage terminase large subunit-like protein
MGFYGWQKTGGDESDLILIQQNAQTLSNAIRLCEADFKHKLINYNDNAVDKWCFGNACLKLDNLRQCLIVKAKPSQRIDGAVSLAILYEMYRRYRTDFKTMVEGAA